MSNLVSLGWDDRVAAHAADLPADLVPGRVVRVDRGRCSVATDSDPLRPITPYPVAVGDWVAVDPVADRITIVLPRRSALTRHGPGRETAELVLAANLDRVCVVHGANLPVNRRRLERELVVAWDSGAVPIVVLTKADLCTDLAGAVEVAERGALGAEVLVVSNATGAGLDALASRVGAGCTFALIGASGAGKSSIVNSLAGEAIQTTQDIREGDGRGRHTTTAGQLVVLPGGGILIDTPGIRSVGLWDGTAGVEHVFADIEELAGGCRFGDCDHRTEPGCAVRDAVDADRLEHWRRLRREIDRVSGQRAGWELAEERKQRRAFARSVRQVKPRR